MFFPVLARLAFGRLGKVRSVKSSDSICCLAKDEDLLGSSSESPRSLIQLSLFGSRPLERLILTSGSV